jgi:succinyl-diaminopimelate desuccinylase
MNYEEVALRIEQEKNYIVEILRKIIAVDTSVPPGNNYDKMIDILEPEFQQYGFETKRVIVPPKKVQEIPLPLKGKRSNFIAGLTSGKPRVSLYAHMDVVPVDDAWTVDPFGGDIIEDRLYGRGTVDDKGPMACVLGAIRVMHQLGLEPKYDIECLFCTDEEIGHYPGSRYLAEKGYFSNHIIWMDGGAMAPVFIHGAAGAVSIDVTAVGKSCHSGMNYLGINAIEEIVPILNELLSLKKEVEKRQSSIPCLPNPQNPNKNLTPMFNLAIINGGTKDNIVPGECHLTINRRYIREENYEDVIDEITRAIEKGKSRSKLIGLKQNIRHVYRPVSFDPHTPALDNWMKSIKTTLGYDELFFGGMGGSTDLGFVLDELISESPEIITTGLVRLTSNFHGADEHVYIEDLLSFTKLLVHYFAF